MPRHKLTRSEILGWFRSAHVWHIANRDGKLTRQAIRDALKAIGAPCASEESLHSHELRWATVSDWLTGRGDLPGGEDEDVADLGGPLIDPQQQDVTGEDCFKALAKHGDNVRDAVERNTYQDIVLPEDGPVGILVQGDPHIGHSACLYSLLKQRVVLLRRRDIPVYSLCAGDILDGKFGVAAFRIILSEQAGTPFQHILAAAHWIEESATPKEHGLPSLLGLVQGNHDYWSHRETGVGGLDTALAIVQEKINYSPTELRLNIRHGSVQRQWVLRHKVQGKSMYNPAHGVQRWLRNNAVEDSDVVAAGHTHEAGVCGPLHLYGKPRYGIQVAAYVDGQADEYAVTQGYPIGQHAYPDCLCICYPDRREMRTFLDVEFGVWVLEQHWRELRLSRKRTRSVGKRKR